jgi:hypothetical protein
MIGRAAPNHIKTMLCGNFIGIDKLERLILLQSDPLINEFAITITEPETVVLPISGVSGIDRGVSRVGALHPLG